MPSRKLASGFAEKIFLCCLLLAVLAFPEQAWSQSGSGTQSAAKKRIAPKKRSGPQKNALVARGKALFLANGCVDCHRVAGAGASEGVLLDGVGKRRTRKFLQEHLRDPEEHVARNAEAFGGDPNMMTAPNLNQAEIDALVAYLMTLSR